MGDGRYLGAREAAGELGVSVRTLYAYVSRGLVRSEKVDGGGRGRRYRAEDVRRLREKKERRRDPDLAASGALDWGTPVLESGITLISDGRMYYRGEDAVVLSERRSFEEVASLIWTGEVGDLEGGAVRVEGTFEGGPTEVLGATLQAAAVRDAAAWDLRPRAVARTGARILRTMVRAVAGGGGGVARALQEAWVPRDAEAEGLIGRALVLCADHELNVSAFTARCVASAGATPYAAVIAGLAALGGVEHGGNTGRVEAFLDEARTARSPREAVVGRMRRGEALPGFGHRLYPEGDVRAAAILGALSEARSGSGVLGASEAVAAAVDELVGERPNLDFALVALARTLGLPEGAALTVFALGRTAGWIGHAIEQYGEGALIRPRARYIGPPPL